MRSPWRLTPEYLALILRESEYPMKPRPLRHMLRHAIALSAGLGLATLALAQPYSNLYVFGDSLSDVGNDYAITGGAVPTAAYYTNGTTVGRFTDGLNYADVLAAGLGLSLTPSVLGGNDYAFGGARVNSSQAGLPPTAQSFNQQITAFDSTHALADPNALYVLWIGANDMSDAITQAALAAQANNPAAAAAAVSSAITATLQGVGGAIQNLASLGATHFLIPNLPDLSLTPQVSSLLSPQLSGLAQNVSQSYDAALAATLSQAPFTSLDIHQLNVYALQTAISNNPGAYGFTNTTSSCYTGEVDGSQLAGGPVPSVCGSPSTYVYWDYEHPTATLHADLGAAALAAAVPEPAQWAMLACGLAALAWRRRARAPVPIPVRL